LRCVPVNHPVHGRLSTVHLRSKVLREPNLTGCIYLSVKTLKVLRSPCLIAASKFPWDGTISSSIDDELGKYSEIPQTLMSKVVTTPHHISPSIHEQCLPRILGMPCCLELSKSWGLNVIHLKRPCIGGDTIRCTLFCPSLGSDWRWGMEGSTQLVVA
jgi:hypothetical protein